MNTKLSDKVEEIKNKFKFLLIEKNEEEGIEHDAYMLMAGYLSEIERVQENKKINRKDLAIKINTSASYLTQVFRGNKPMNFYTLAKIQRALKIKFQVSAVSLNPSPIYSMNILPLEKLEDYSKPQTNKEINNNIMYHISGGGYYKLKESEKTA